MVVPVQNEREGATTNTMREFSSLAGCAVALWAEGYVKESVLVRILFVGMK